MIDIRRTKEITIETRDLIIRIIKAKRNGDKDKEEEEEEIIILTGQGEEVEVGI